MHRLSLGLVIVVVVLTNIYGLPRSDPMLPPDMWLPGVFPSGLKPIDSQTAIRAACSEEIGKPPVMRDLSHPPGTLDMDDEPRGPEVLNLAVSDGFEEDLTNKKRTRKSHKANKRHSRKPLILCGATIWKADSLPSNQPVYQVYKVAPVMIYLPRLTPCIHIRPITVGSNQLRETGVQLNNLCPSAKQHHPTAQTVPVVQGSRGSFSSSLNPPRTLNQPPLAIPPQSGTYSMATSAPGMIVSPQSGSPFQLGLNIPPQTLNVPQTGPGLQLPPSVTSIPGSGMLPKPAFPPGATSFNPIQPAAQLPPPPPVAPLLPQPGRIPMPQSVVSPGIGPALPPRPPNSAQSMPMGPQPAPALPQPPLPPPPVAPQIPQPGRIPMPQSVVSPGIGPALPPQPPNSAQSMPMGLQPAPALPQPPPPPAPNRGIAIGPSAVPPPRPVIPVNTQ